MWHCEEVLSSIAEWKPTGSREGLPGEVPRSPSFLLTTDACVIPGGSGQASVHQNQPTNPQNDELDR